MYNVLKEISDKSEIDFVKKAANELRISTENQYLEYVSEFKIMLQDFGYSFDEIAIDAMLIKVGPVGWAVMIGRGLSNLISGIGATSREHIYMISAGEAGRYAAMALNRSVEDKGYYLSQIGINTMDYYLLCGLMRISGEIKVIDSCNAKSGLFRWFDDSDEVVSFCESNISRIENLFVKHGLDK